MAIVGALSPLLFMTFHELYNVSYSLLGALVVINFVTQLTVDLIFSFFSHKFNIPLAVKIAPVLTFIGLIIYAASPMLFSDNVYLGLAVGTVIFSASSGFNEVLLSPVIASIPSENPEREMSKLHSVYAWGSFAVVVISALFLLIFKKEAWPWLALLFSAVAVISFFAFLGAKIPAMQTQERVSGVLTHLKNKQLWICVIAIFLGGASECTMAQWSSGYLEAALGIPKVVGDIAGVALFAVMLGIGRSLYAKRGKNIEKTLIFSAASSALCYLIAALTSVSWLALIACGLCGLAVAMLWPGNLVVASERISNAGVFIYAIMAAGGDLGAAVGPQLVGIITDAAEISKTAASLAQSFGITATQLGMKLGMLVGMLFPLALFILYLFTMKRKNKVTITPK